MVLPMILTPLPAPFVVRYAFVPAIVPQPFDRSWSIVSSDAAHYDPCAAKPNVHTVPAYDELAQPADPSG